MMYVLDYKGFTEHGGSIGGCWLTDKGRRLLTVLDAWNNVNSNEDELQEKLKNPLNRKFQLFSKKRE